MRSHRSRLRARRNEHGIVDRRAASQRSVVAGAGFEPVTFSYESISVGQIRAAQLQFRNRGADHRRRTLPPIDRLTTSSAQIFASLGFDLSHFYAIVTDFHTRVQHRFSKPRYSVLMSSHLSRSGAVRGIRQWIKRHAKQAIGKRASQRVKQPICQNEIRRSRLSL